MVTLIQGDGRSTAAPVKRAAEWWVESVGDLASCEQIRSAWDDLAWHAIEPNAFYEPWLLLPLWQAYFADQRVQLILIYRSGAKPNDPPELCGLVPVWQRSHDKLPISVWSLWQNDYICNCTPLLRQGVATDAWRIFCDWLATQKLPLMELPLVNGDGPFQHALLEVANERQTPMHVNAQYSRALLRPAESAEVYCSQSMTCHNRQELRRQRRRLGEQGQLEVRVTQPGDDIAFWIEEFLRLEAAGWKGREGTALAADETNSQFTRSVIEQGFARNQVALLGLFLDGRAIALKLNFLSGEGGFTYKIAFDEAFKKYSPGVQLELENIDWFHAQRGLAWLDSCARPEHFMIGRLWKDRRIMQRLTLSSGTRTGDLLIGGLACLKGIKAALKPRHSSRFSSPEAQAKFRTTQAQETSA